jgi:threonine synthase
MNEADASHLVYRLAEKDVMTRWRGIIEEYRKFLPVTAQTPVITLGEGNTPLIRAARLAKKIAPGWISISSMRA